MAHIPQRQSILHRPVHSQPSKAFETTAEAQYQKEQVRSLADMDSRALTSAQALGKQGARRLPPTLLAGAPFKREQAPELTLALLLELCRRG